MMTAVSRYPAAFTCTQDHYALAGVALTPSAVLEVAPFFSVRSEGRPR